ncbi:hypothetical protein N7466_006322 [Penicillium verhagenii]|uniref:uncharacterized protein n=1 Tax=Penicillium verhagenii TaxID=1562060 RepID=UPI00254545D0|nr:uncharacterized protein N7466_006322 [Penicillium verhagenii]KAJ5930829.1 hypothetical protein N7466_006322 [Penicillium verhagenii]
MFAKNIILAATWATSALALSAVGSGTWTSVSPTFNSQTCEGGSIDGDIFTLPSTATGSEPGSYCDNGHLRAERRYVNDYTTGTHQFAGTFKVTSFGGTNISIKQTFNEGGSLFFLLGVNSDGDLYNVEGGTIIASGVATVGTTVTVNTIHDVSTSTYTVYVNGVEKYSITSPAGEFYDKVGTYQTDSGDGPITVDWSAVAFWTQ